MNDRGLQLDEVISFIVVYYKELICMALIISLFVMESQLIKNGVIYGGHTRKLKRAKEKNHQVLAKLASQTRDMRDDTNDIRRTLGKYEYLVGGKKFHKYLTFTSYPPAEMTFYWDENPKRVFREERDAKLTDIFIVLVPVAIGIAVYMMLLRGGK